MTKNTFTTIQSLSLCTFEICVRLLIEYVQFLTATIGFANYAKITL